MIYHIASMLAGFLMDLLLGDPYWLPHPIRLIGNWISFLEKRLLGSKTEEKQGINPVFLFFTKEIKRLIKIDKGRCKNEKTLEAVGSEENPDHRQSVWGICE